ncbi:uncharacterized protein E0L32_003706 [Thyridium curvatum]|uniref:LSM2-LSM8 complex subunit LSM8 n=1 Tax=Thyridium curvatum TaxID=1093900 RepID=A0A507B104_9PEZI|nr:uncharacterized protein E0L32_003706 [Thyridium curvatum]TPX16765.1 hypothetical protein E0L32_003706 [Thyridium curvatum]
MSFLNGYIDSSATDLGPCFAFRAEKVLVITADSRTIVGELVSVDNQTNLVLKSAVERVINTPDNPEPSVEVPLGLYLIRGDNVCTVGLVDEKLDAEINWTKVKGEVIGGIKHI